MSSRTVSRALVALATGAFSLGVLVPAAQAEAPVEQGWWTVTNAGPVAAPTASDVPEDGLLVQGGLTGPTAIAGLVYEFDAAATVEKLVLTLAPDAASTPATTLQLCALTSPALKPAQGGPMAEAPEYDCEREVSGQPDDDGKTYSFDVAALASSGTLAFAILPAASSDRVVFAKPGEDSLVTTAPPSTGDESFGSPTPADPPSESFEASTGGPSSFDESTGGLDMPAFEAAPAQAPAEPLLAPEAASEEPAVAQDPVFTQAAPVTLVGADADEQGSVIARAVLVLALATGVGLWTAAGRTSPPESEAGVPGGGSEAA